METETGSKTEAKLYLCPTPIGNLGDITMRTAATLAAADAVYCEDTRNTLRLLNALGIKKPLFSCHEHTEQRTAAAIIAEVRSGKAIAFVSDAGMPGVSDPGARLVRECIRAGVPFEVLPGASAMVTAWVASGLDTESLLFMGFLPRGGAERAEAIARALRSEATVCLYESPLRVGATLNELLEALRERSESETERRCVLIRELTKLYEEHVRGTVKELAERYRDEAPKGECVLLLEGAKKAADEYEAGAKLDALLTALLEEGLSVRTASRIAADTLGLPKNAVYKRAREIGETKD